MNISMLKKKNINTRSLTESEIVGADDSKPQILWTKYLLEAQGYEITERILYQENKSAILLENNRKLSSRYRTKNIKVPYYFIENRIKKGGVEVKCCPATARQPFYEISSRNNEYS